MLDGYMSNTVWASETVELCERVKHLKQTHSLSDRLSNKMLARLISRLQDRDTPNRVGSDILGQFQDILCETLSTSSSFGVGFPRGSPCLSQGVGDAFAQGGKPYEIPLPTKLMRKLVNSDQHLGAFVGELSHDLSSPLPVGLLPSAGLSSRCQGQFPTTASAQRQLCSVECTLVVRHLFECVQDDLLNHWDPKIWKFDFLFLPFCEKRHHHVTYCFINFHDNEAASAFREQFEGKIFHSDSGHRESYMMRVGRQHDVVEIHLADVQGYKKNMIKAGERLANSWRKQPHFPAVFDQSGEPCDFQQALTQVSLQGNAMHLSL